MNKGTQLTDSDNISRYAQFWETLKANKVLELEVKRDTHAYIIRKLQRHSLKDSTYRFKCVENGHSYVIAHNSIGDYLIVRLEFKDKIPKKFVDHKEY